MFFLFFRLYIFIAFLFFEPGNKIFVKCIHTFKHFVGVSGGDIHLFRIVECGHRHNDAMNGGIFEYISAAIVFCHTVETDFNGDEPGLDFPRIVSNWFARIFCRILTDDAVDAFFGEVQYSVEFFTRVEFQVRIEPRNENIVIVNSERNARL